MNSFWRGFEGRLAPITFKHYQIMVFWSPGHEDARTAIHGFANKYPTVRVKVINIRRDPRRVERYHVTNSPTVLLLKDGLEVDRDTSISPTILELMFRKAHV